MIRLPPISTWTATLFPFTTLFRTTAPLANADSLLPTDFASADSRFVLNYFRLSADKRLIFGGGERYSQTPPRDIAALVRPFMAQVFPQIADARIDYRWGGVVGVTMNRLPHIGRREIGRGSCRERVCTDGKIAVVAVALT